MCNELQNFTKDCELLQPLPSPHLKVLMSLLYVPKLMLKQAARYYVAHVSVDLTALSHPVM